MKKKVEEIDQQVDKLSLADYLDLMEIINIALEKAVKKNRPLSSKVKEIANNMEPEPLTNIYCLGKAPILPGDGNVRFTPAESEMIAPLSNSKETLS